MLQRITLGYKPIHLIQQGAFEGLRCLTYLKLPSCSLNKMPPLDPIQSTLEVLNLRENSLVVIPHNYFHGFSKLAQVILSYNKLNALPDFTVVAETLYILEVANNRIASLRPSVTNTTFLKLRRLDIAVNDLEYHNLEMFIWWPLLAYLYIDYNCIQTLKDLSTITLETHIKARLNAYTHLHHPRISLVKVLSISLANSITRSHIPYW